MNTENILRQVKATLDRLAETLIPPGSALSPMLVKVILYILVFVAFPLLVVVSLPYGLGLILLVGFIALLIFGIPNF